MGNFSCHRFCTFSAAVALLTLTMSVSAADFARVAWKKTLSTKDSADEVSAVIAAKVGGEDVIIIAGEVSAVRGAGAGLEGLVKGAAIANKRAIDKEDYVDGFVAQLSAKSKEVMWVYRYNDGKNLGLKSKFSGVAFDQASGHVFAVGQKKDERTRVFVPFLAIISASNGEAVKTVEYKSSSKASGNAFFSAVSFFNGDLYMCGTDTAGVKAGRKRVEPSGKRDGGLFFVRANAKTGSETWSRQAGSDRIRDRCSGIALSDDGLTAYFAATEYSNAPLSQKSPRTGHVVGYSLGRDTGDLAWRSAVAGSENGEVQDTAMGIAQRDGAVYLSSAKWIDAYRGSRMYLYKLSGRTGQRLFAVESCCGDILPRIPGDFRGKGSAEPSRGLFVGEDGFVYQLGSYKAREKRAADGYASFVVRTSIFGDRETGKDSSDPLEKFQFEATKPRMMTPTADNTGLIAVELSGDFSRTNAEARNVKVVDIHTRKVNPARRVRYRSSEGTSLVQVSSRLTASLVLKHRTLVAFGVAVADSLHLPSDMVVARHDSKTDETVVAITIHTNDAAGEKGGKDAAEIKHKLDKLLVNSTGGSQSDIERMLGLRSGTLKVIEPSKVTRAGVPIIESKALNGTTSAPAGQTTETSSDSEESESAWYGIPKMYLIAGITGGGAVLVLLIAVTAAICLRRRVKKEGG